jgi:hypothetical protein
MLSIIQTIAERKIQQAIAEGTVLDLSHWKDKPLPPDDMAHVPEDLRMAYRLLKNAGYVPEEVALQKEITCLEQMLTACTDEKEKIRQLKRISCLKTKLECRMGRSIELGEDGPYYNRVVVNYPRPNRVDHPRSSFYSSVVSLNNPLSCSILSRLPMVDRKRVVCNCWKSGANPRRSLAVVRTISSIRCWRKAGVTPVR